jgi:serine protease Do
MRVDPTRRTRGRNHERSALRWVLGLLILSSAVGIAVGYLLPGQADVVAGESEMDGSASNATVVSRNAAAGPVADVTAARPARVGEISPPLGQTMGQSVLPGGRRRTPIVEAASAVIPSVVSVNVVRVEERRPLFQFFVPEGYERQVRSLGSGVAIDREGHILTNHHVVHNALEIIVADATGKSYSARLVGEDSRSDVALLQIQPGAVPPAPVGTSSDLMVGEPAIAIGNPFGYLLTNSEATVTTGVISGVGRNILPSDPQERLYGNMIQTDASINPGNSGGPLLNADGQVVGINSSIFSRSGGSEGLGFAIPIDRAMRIARELIEFGRIRQPWIGVDVAESELDTLRSPVVRRVAPDSPAGRAGIRPGDHLLQLGDDRIDGPVDWTVALNDSRVNADVRLRYLRGGSVREASLRVDEVPSERAERIQVGEGLELIDLTPEIAVERSLELEHGALITSIDQRTGAVTGLRVGDVILGINRSQVTKAADVGELLRYYGSGQIVVTFHRAGQTVYSAFVIR